ncbi:MAG TPA: hypothetical protein VN688_04460, partial [Gemmataceae bacterium]|nr:hypothetical protein [Gemmataceae bacterium]
FLLAQSIDTVVRDEAVRRQLTERGWRRYQNFFCNQRIEHDFLQALRPLLTVPARRRAGIPA